MAAGYTSEEVQAKIDLFLLSRVEVARTQSGARDVLAARDQIYDLLSTSILLRPDSFFYIVWLAKNRIQAKVAQQIAAITSLQTAYSGVNRAVRKITTTTDLTNAEAALTSLSSGLNSRQGGVRGSIGPAVDRFRRNIERFITSELQRNVIVSGTATATPDELRNEISSLWADAQPRHDEIIADLGMLTEALTALNRVSLPERAIRDIVERIRTRLSELKTDLGGSAGLAKSREAMLELFVMRTLLTKASSFQVPSLELMPLTGDGTEVKITDGETTGALTGNVSGPFNYAAGATLSLQTSSGTSTVTLPGESSAELRSMELDPISPISFVPSGHLRLRINFGAAAVYSFSASPYATPADLATDINAALVPDGATCTFDVSTNQLVIKTSTTGDVAALEIEPPQSVNEEQFRDILGFAPYGRGDHPTAAEVVLAINSGSARTPAEVVEVDYGIYNGSLPSSGSYVDIVKTSGADMVVTAGSTTVTSTRRFDALGIEPGDALRIDSLGFAGLIEEVNGNSLVLASAPSLVFSGTYDFIVGPDLRSVPKNARVRILSYNERDNTGLYRVSASDFARLSLDRAAPVLPDTEVLVSVFEHFVKVSAPATGSAEGISAFPATAGSTALGYSVTATLTKGQGNTASLVGSGDFLARGVKSGDLLTLAGVGTVTVDTVSIDELTFSPAVSYPATNVEYSIVSSRYTAYNTLSAAVSAFAELYENVDVLDGYVRRILRGARYEVTHPLFTSFTSYLTALSTLETALDAYVVPLETTIDNILRMLQEQGLDRAYDVLLSLDIEQFFSMSAEASSYGTNLSRAAATAARMVSPESKFAKSQIVVQEVRPLSFQPNISDD